MIQRLLECPACRKVGYDASAGICQSCGVAGTIANTAQDLEVNERALAGLLRNARIGVFSLAPTAFQQVLGIFGPVLGDSNSSGIPFTEETCRLAHEHLAKNGVLCARVEVTANGRTSHSLLVSPTVEGIERGLRAARKAARKHRARVEVWFDQATLPQN